jgi:hypothetical protein
MATAEEVAAIEQASNDIAAAATAVHDRVNALLVELGAQPDPTLDAAIAQLRAAADVLGTVGVTQTAAPAVAAVPPAGVDPGPPSIPVVDEQGTALASGTGDPNAIIGAPPGANQTSDQTVPVDELARAGAPATAEAATPEPAGPARLGGLALYTHDGPIDPAFADKYPQAAVNTSDGQPLYTFTGDNVDGPATADGIAGWHVYTGAPVAV